MFDSGSLAIVVVGAVAMWGALNPHVSDLARVRHAVPVDLIRQEDPMTVRIPLQDQRFEVVGLLNGVGIRLTVDTGSMFGVILAPDDAALLEHGLVPDGKTRVADVAGFTRVVRQVRIAEVRIGEIVFTDVSAVVMSTGTNSLLGLPLLKKLARFEYRGGELVLEQ